MCRSGKLISFDKSQEIEKATTSDKNSAKFLAQKLNVENYMEILDAYSLLLFSILGVEFDNYMPIFKPHQRLFKFDKIYSYSNLYSDFFVAFKKLKVVSLSAQSIRNSGPQKLRTRVERGLQKKHREIQ